MSLSIEALSHGKRTTSHDADHPPKGKPAVFLRDDFRRTLAREFNLEAVTVHFDHQQHAICWPAYRYRKGQRDKLIIGAGFDKTGEVVLPDQLSFPALLHSLTEGLRLHSPVSELEIRTQHHIACLHDHADKAELRVRLDIPCSQRLMQFSKSTRRNIRLPFKHGFDYRIDNDYSQLRAFYQLYLRSMHELGSLPHSWQFFHKIWSDFRDDIALFTGYMDGKPVVASFLFLSADEAYGAWSGTHPDYKEYSVFIAMLWSIMEFCEASQRSCYNLGRSSIGSGSYAFKKRLANEEQRIHYYRIATQRPDTKRPVTQRLASWLIRHSPEFVMHTLAHTQRHRFY